jgi:hypothetical protein
MPSIKEHLETAERFQRLFEAIPDDFPDGRALALFYSALHYVEAVAAATAPPRHNRIHHQREEWIMNNHPTVWKHYHPLWENSEKARYLAGGPFVMNASAVNNYLKSKHLSLEKWARAILSGRL